jgi:hypothetical protein
MPKVTRVLLFPLQACRSLFVSAAIGTRRFSAVHVPRHGTAQSTPREKLFSQTENWSASKQGRDIERNCHIGDPAPPRGFARRAAHIGRAKVALDSFEKLLLGKVTELRPMVL